MSTPKLDKLRILEWPMTYAEHEITAIISFSNDRYHSVTIHPSMSPDEIGRAFITCGENIRHDEELK